MTPAALPMDPNLEEVLATVAAAPDSRLFLADPRSVVDGLLERTLIASSREAGLSAAERHLLDSYRAEVAFLLRQAALIRSQDDPFVRQRIFRDFDVPTEEDWKARAKECVAANEAPAGMELLRACFEGGLDAAPGAMLLARASLRFVDTVEARLYIANDLMASGELRSAEVLLHDAASRPALDATHRFTTEKLGHLYAEMGRFDASLGHYARLVDVEPHQTRALLFGLICALQLGDRAQLVELDRRVSEAVDPDGLELAKVSDQLRQRDEGDSFQPTAACRALASDVRDSLCPLGGWIIDELLQ